jgi:hypothetical protein
VPSTWNADALKNMAVVGSCPRDVWVARVV